MNTDFNEYKYWYINKDSATIYVGLNEKLVSDYHLIGEGWDDYEKGAWVLLSKDQISFKNDNPDASVQEVLNMQLELDSESEPAPEPSPEDLFKKAVSEKVCSIRELDNASNVFYVKQGENKIALWLDKNTRNSILNVTLPAERAKGKTSTTLWNEGNYMNNIAPIPLTVPIEWMEEKLLELELYAKETYDIKNENFAALFNCTSIEEVKNLDIMSKYPKPRVFELAQNA